MKNLLDLFTSDYVSALGWTLLHSLWQAALLGLVAALGFYLLRRRSAQSRYTLGVAALGAQILASVATYIYYLPSALEKSTTTLFTNYQFVGTSAGVNSPASPLPVLLQMQLWLAMHLNELVICWLIGVGVLLLRFAGGWIYLERLRFGSRPVRDGGWQTRFGVLVARLDIGRAVELRETARIVTPMVVGVLRPVVLMPIGLLAGLSAAQVEAILAHELAHIRRHDYLVNLVQSFVEVVYFFHPVLWWLSGRIRAEREHCCDDLAMAVCDDRLSLAHALVRVAEFRAQPALVVAFAANKRQLLSRVRRVLGVAEPTTQRFAGYLPMAVVLLSLSVGASVYAFQGKKPEEKLQQNKVKTEKSRQAESNADTLIEHIIEVQVDEQFDEQKNVELDTQQGGTGTSTEWGPVKKITGWNGELFYVSEGETVKMLDRRSFNNDSLEKKMAEYHAKMEALQKEMQPYQKEIQGLQKQMEPLHQRIADLKLFFISEGETVKMLDRKSFNNDSLEKKMAEYHAKMEALQKEMQPYQEEIQSLQKRMEPLHQRIADLNLQMQKENFAVERFQREAEKLDWKKDQLMEARQQLTEKRSTVMYPKSGQAKANAAETEKQLADFETQIKAKEQEIDALNDQIKQSRVQAKEAEKPMDNLNSEMEKINRETDVYSRKMDEIGRKMDAVGRKMDAVGKAMAQESINQVIHQSTSTLRSTTITYPRPPKAPTTKSIRGSGRISPAAAPAVPKAPAAPPKKN